MMCARLIAWLKSLNWSGMVDDPARPGWMMCNSFVVSEMKVRKR
jgi:hypothetical protein